MSTHRHLFLFFFLIATVHTRAQVWQYPYRPMGIEETSPKNKKNLQSFAQVSVDSSADGIYTTYSVYRNGKQIAESFDGGDTSYIEYDKFGFQTLGYTRGKDSMFIDYERNKSKQITKRTSRTKRGTMVISYEYNKKGLISALYLNGVLYDKISYDQKNRLQSVEEYRHEGGKLSEIKNYSYSGDTIIYESCPYNTSGVRYDWPCEVTKGLLNENDELKELYATVYDSRNGVHTPVYDNMIVTYTADGKVLSYQQTMSNGSYGAANYYYDEKGGLIRWEAYSNGQLVRSESITRTYLQ